MRKHEIRTQKLPENTKTQNTALYMVTILAIFSAKPIRGAGINNDIFCFTTMSWSEVLTSLFLVFLSSMQYKGTFAFLWQGKAFASITNTMANEQRRKIGNFGGMKFKTLQHDKQHDHGRIELHNKRVFL